MIKITYDLNSGSTTSPKGSNEPLNLAQKKVNNFIFLIRKIKF